jgi:RES domain-containing protein
MDPLTICQYTVNVDDVVDLRTDADRVAVSVQLSELSCEWAYDRANGREPASWGVARKLISVDAAGILVPSFTTGAAADMSNLVLWKWGPAPPHHVEVFDPSGRLPKNQLSWPTA